MKQTFNSFKYGPPLLALSLVVLISGIVLYDKDFLRNTAMAVSIEPSSLAVLDPTLYYYDFRVPSVLHETGSIEESRSPYWWLNSGAYLYIDEGVGRTVQGRLPRFSIWRLDYARSNPVDTENGFLPQNIFRLLTRGEWQDFNQEAYFKVVRENFTDSPNRNVSNGLMLMFRYQDSDNLYYIGLRKDGYAVVKKKLNGHYETLALERVMVGREDDSTLGLDSIPKNTWIGIRGEIVNNPDGSVTLRAFTDFGRLGMWRLVLETVDDGQEFGKPILESGHAGIRTDFMDVEFSEYKILE
ncbi:MAG: hypothetical protein WDZ64_01220 [Parcubacteria group bacterium]